MNRHGYECSSDSFYFVITDDILDGIFSAEECGVASSEDTSDDSSDCDCDWKIFTGYGGGGSSDIQEEPPWQVEVQPIQPADGEHHATIQHLVQFCLRFSTPAHSALCIIILSIINISYSIWEGEF